MNKYVVFSGLGFELLSMVGAAVWLGLFLDEKFGTKGVFIVILSLIFLMSWLAHVIILAKKMEK